MQQPIVFLDERAAARAALEAGEAYGNQRRLRALSFLRRQAEMRELDYDITELGH